MYPFDVWRCEYECVYFNIIKTFTNLFCVGYIQLILHGDYINI